MASGQFLSDLASGIFQRRNELQKEQDTRDFQSQEGLIRMLSGLVDKVEDPAPLMGHIWDTMGIKKQTGGKGLRGFLDAFSGMPNRSVEDQLGTKFRELTGSFMGGGEAKGIRQRSQVAQKGLPYPGGYAPPTPGPFMDKAKADQARLDKSIVFRDPQQEELNKIRLRAEAQSALTTDRLALQNTYTSRENELKRQHQFDIQSYKDENKRSAKTQQLGANLFIANPERYGYDPSQAQQEAAQRMVNLDDAQIDNLLARTVVQRKVAKKIGAELGEGGKKITPYQQEQLENETLRSARGILDEFGPSAKAALEDEKAFNALAGELEKFAASKGVTYSRDTGGFVGDPTKVITARALANASGMLDTATKAREKFRAAEGKAQAGYLQLKDRKYEGYLDIGASWRDPVSISQKRARGQAPPKATLPRAGLGTARTRPRPPTSIMISRENDPNLIEMVQGKKEGTIVEKDGKRYSIFQVGTDNVILVPVPERK